MKCNNCDYENPEGNKFCAECGTKLGIMSSMIECHICHNQIPTDSKYCPDCGSQLFYSQNSRSIVIIEKLKEYDDWYNPEEDDEEDLELYSNPSYYPLLGVKIVSDKGKMVYTSQRLLKYDEFIIRNGYLYVFQPTINVDVNNSVWEKIDCDGDISFVKYIDIPKEEILYDTLPYEKKEDFLNTHPNINSIDTIGKLNGKFIFLAVTEEQEDNGPAGATVYNEDFIPLFTVGNRYYPYRVYESGFFMIEDSITKKSGLMDLNQNIVMPCIWDEDSQGFCECLPGVFRVSTGDDKEHNWCCYDVKSKQWYREEIEGYLIRDANDDEYELIDPISNKVLGKSASFGTYLSHEPDDFNTVSDYTGFYIINNDYCFHIEHNEDICSNHYARLHDVDCDGLEKRFISENRILTYVHGEYLDDIKCTRIRNYEGKVLKEFDNTYLFKTGFKFGKALFIKDTSINRRVGYVDLSGNVTILPVTIPLEDKYGDPIEQKSLSCEMISEDTIGVANSLYYYLLKLDGTILSEDEQFFKIDDNLIEMYKYIDGNRKKLLCDGHGEVIYKFNDIDGTVQILK